MLSTLSDYLFNIKPNMFEVYGIYFIVSALIALIASLFIAIFNNKIPKAYKTSARRAKKVLLWYACISLFLYFVRQQRIPYLSMRIWLWLWVIVALLMIIVTLYIEHKKIPFRREKIIEDMKRKRYFEN